VIGGLKSDEEVERLLVAAIWHQYR
jgi:hypothetical protein